MAAEVSRAVDADGERPDVATAGGVEQAVEGLGGTPVTGRRTGLDAEPAGACCGYGGNVASSDLCLMHSKDQSSPGWYRMPVEGVKRPGSTEEELKSGSAHQASNAAVVGASITSTTPTRMMAWQTRHNGDRKRSQQSTELASSAAAAAAGVDFILASRVKFADGAFTRCLVGGGWKNHKPLEGGVLRESLS